MYNDLQASGVYYYYYYYCYYYYCCTLYAFLFSGLTEVDVERGDISVGSASGKLKAVTKHGNINVNLAHLDIVTLKSKEGRLLFT